MDTTRTFERRSRLPVPATEAFAWHLRPGAFERLLPPGDGTRVEHRSGRIEQDTMRVLLSVPVLAGIRQRWVIRHEGYEEGRRFFDVLEKGPFRSWRHEHLIEPDGDDASVLIDRIAYQLPLGPLGAVAGTPIVRRRLEGMFEHRHAITRDDLAAHAHAGLAPLRIDVDGSWPGSLDVQVAAFLSTGGHDVGGSVELVGEESIGDRAPADVVVTGRGQQHVEIAAGDDARVILDSLDDPVTAPRAVLATIGQLVGAARP
jgi:uncharacterized protein